MVVEAETDPDLVARVAAVVVPEVPGVERVRVGAAEPIAAEVCGTPEKPRAEAAEARDLVWAVEVEAAPVQE